MSEEDTIERIIKRDLDRLPMLPADRWIPRTPPSRSWARRAALIPMAMLIILVAVGAGLGLADWRAHRSASDEAQAAASGIPGPLLLAGGAPSLGFGLVSTSANTLLIRNETTEAAPFTIASALPQVVVSPDGHSFAYWLALPGRSGQATYELHYADVLNGSSIAAPSSPGSPNGPTSSPLLRASDNEVPGAFSWSSDGTGLIASTHAPAQRGGPAAGTGSTSAHWYAIDVPSGKVTPLAAAFADVVSTVYAWDRQRDLVTGSGLDAGQNTFTALQAGRITSHAIPEGAMFGAADIYGHSVVITYANDCKGIGTTARCPVLEVHDQATFATIAASPVGEATSDFPDVVFRPRSQDLIVQLPLKNGDARVELWSDLGRGPHQVLATYTQLVRGTIRFTGRRELILPRADGSAVFVLKFDGSAGGRWFGEIVGLLPIKGATGFERTPFEILGGGNPLASVVLDPAFARAMEPKAATRPTPIPSADKTPAPSAAACPQAAGVILDARLGNGPSQPGLSRAVPTGASRGPTSVAVDETGRTYLWDQANGRVLVYDAGCFVRAIPVAVSREARELEELNGKLYFAIGLPGSVSRQEWELDASTGAVIRTIPPAPTGRQTTLYPTMRWTPATPAVNGVWPIGMDRYGNRYVRFIDGTCSRGAAVCGEVRRLTANGTLLETATEPAGIAVEDYYVARDGSVYELRTDRSPNGDAAGVFVIRLLSALPVPHSQVGLDGQVRDYDRMRQDGVQKPGDPPLIPNDGNPPGSALVADAAVRLEPYGIETRTDAQGKFTFPTVDVAAPCRWVTVVVTKAGFGSYRAEFALYSPDGHVGLQLWLEHHDVDMHLGPPQAEANLGDAYCWR